MRGLLTNVLSLKRVYIASAILSLSACATGPTRSDPKDFKLVLDGHVSMQNAHLLADCILDGFDKAHSKVWTNIPVRQQRRADSTRVESLAGGTYILMSADIFDDGRAELYESIDAAMINTSGERQAFRKCLAQYTKS